MMNKIIKETIKKVVGSPLRIWKTMRMVEKKPREEQQYIAIENILRSGERLMPSNLYSRLVGQPLRASERVIDGPHVKLLREYQKYGDEILEPLRFKLTDYYKNAAECISYTGHYFPYVKKESQIVEVAASFIESFIKNDQTHRNLKDGHNSPDELCEVRPIQDSSCYELVNGNHRIASAWVNGSKSIMCKVHCGQSTTPAQDLLREVLWQEARIELYQPVNLPEVQEWPTVRLCSDRSAMMLEFLRKVHLENVSYVDVGCSYGWFVKEFNDHGYEATGVERDPFSINVGKVIYGISSNQLIRSDIVDFLENFNSKFEIVSCFSVLHHFAMGKSSISDKELIKLLDKITGKVLFIDTGESGEDWFRESLSDWSPDYIVKYIKDNTTFDTVLKLGTDRDARGKYIGNYGRTLFACFRSSQMTRDEVK